MKRTHLLFSAVAMLALGACVAIAALIAPDLAGAVQASALSQLSPDMLLAVGPAFLFRPLHEAYERKSAGGGGEDDAAVLQIKQLITKQGEAWDEFKRTNEALIKAKADGKAVGDLEAKLDKVSKDMDGLAEMKSQIDALTLKAQRPDLGTDKEAKQLADEVKSFNLAMRTEYQSKGKALPAEFDIKAYGEYKAGFFKMMSGVTADSLSTEERKAMQAGSDPDGGYMLPQSTVGMTVARLWEQSLMRQICDVQTISTAKIEGLLDNDEASAGWVAELGTRSDTGTPQVGKWEIEAHEMYAMPKISQKLIDDAALNVEGWLATKIADKFARVEGTAFWAGTGVGQPRGLAAYTTAATADASRAWGQFEHVVTGANGTFHTTQFDPVHTLMGAFKDAYLNGAQFVMRRAVRTAARLLKESTTNRYLWEPSMQAGQPERFMGYPARVDEYMPALATGSLSLAFGNFREAYTIVDRIGIRTLRDPYTAKPYVVFYSTKRTGGGAMNFEAVKFLKFST